MCRRGGGSFAFILELVVVVFLIVFSVSLGFLSIFLVVRGLYSTTLETHQLLLGALVEIKIRK